MVDEIVDRLTRSFVAGLHVVEPRQNISKVVAGTQKVILGWVMCT